MKMKQMIMPVLLFMLAAVCMPVQAEGKNAAKAEMVTVNVNQSGAGKSVTLSNTKGKNAKDVKVLKKIITQQNKKNKKNKISTDLNSKQYTWDKDRLTFIDWEKVGLKGSISFAGLTQLEGLNCSSNKLSKLNVKKNTKLNILACGGNKLSKLDVSKNAKLEYLYCNGNKISNLDVSKNMKLVWLTCSSNKLSKLDVSKNKKLGHLDCAANKLSKLDVSKNTELGGLTCDKNVKVNGCDSDIIFRWDD